MATIISHPAIPLTLAIALGSRHISGRLLVAGILCTMLPDLDVIMFKFGVAYDSPFGHRGFTHSLFFALLIGALFLLFARQLHASALKAFLFTAFSTASHGLLDALTTGGLGAAFFWPFSDTRHFFAYRFILVSPIGIDNFLTSRGWLTLKSELFTIWLPCMLFAATALILRLRTQHGQTA